jgi:hypothetical protein
MTSRAAGGSSVRYGGAPGHHSPDRIIHTWRVVKRVGSGSFGEIFKGVHVTTGEEVSPRPRAFASSSSPQKKDT